MKRLSIISFLLLAVVSLQAQIRKGSTWCNGNTMLTVQEVRQGGILYLTGKESGEGDWYDIEMTLIPIAGKPREYKLYPSRQAEEVDESARLKYVTREGMTTIEYWQDYPSGKSALVDIYVNVVDDLKTCQKQDYTSLFNGLYAEGRLAQDGSQQKRRTRWDIDFINLKKSDMSYSSKWDVEVEKGLVVPIISMYDQYWELRLTVEGMNAYPMKKDVYGVFSRNGKGIALYWADSSKGRFSIASDRLLNREMLRNFSKKALRLMRNEIMARHGYKFNPEKELGQYFGSQQWYRSTPEDSIIKLSYIEEVNVALIKHCESISDSEYASYMEEAAQVEEKVPSDLLQVGESKTVTVRTPLDFVAAIASNTTIIIASNTQLNLTELLNDDEFFNRYGRGWIDSYALDDTPNTSGHQLIASESVFDGRQLDISGVQNLTIRGESNASIVVEPRYSFILNFIDCKNITLDNLTLGHTEGGYCEGGVVGLRRTSQVNINHCDLYGCGTYGIVGYNSPFIEMQNSIIRDCSYGIMELHYCINAHFTNCCFYRNREFTLISADSNCGGLQFEHCKFWQNQGPLFQVGVKTFVNDCAIFHKDDYGTIDMLVSPGDEPGYYGGPKEEELEVPANCGQQ